MTDNTDDLLKSEPFVVETPDPRDPSRHDSKYTVAVLMRLLQDSKQTVVRLQWQLECALLENAALLQAMEDEKADHALTIALADRD